MKKLLLATTFAVVALAAGSAGAADRPVARPLPPSPPPPPPCAQFGGFYVGGNVGWGSGEHRFRDLDGFAAEAFNRFGVLLPNEASRSVNGWAAGVQGGYNWQFRCTLFGIEADYNWTDIEHDFVRTGPLGRATLSVSSSLQSFGTVRARTGVIVDNLLLYVTGGLAYANTERSIALTFANPQFNQGPFSDEKTRLGWTAGFGAEWSFAPNWSLKSEVLYARFETEENAFTCRLLCEPNRSVRFEHESSAWVTRFGLNYRFGGGFGGGTY
jgi:outer membrane immunogenic protein